MHAGGRAQGRLVGDLLHLQVDVAWARSTFSTSDSGLVSC